ncbi:hypothetical protein [uncultured Bacteroides sp.]|uniref:hypothetical protein n=1 Tax=uncultured Bacteroides sp. TaxID=162156 RepID=UPI002AABE6F9|nr:hypothetical protein [uncultured Bacteroides sp.]
MKFKQQILDQLKKKFEGVDEKVLTGIAKNWEKTGVVKTEDDIEDAVEDFTIQKVIEYVGDYRATTAQQNAVTNYEKKHGLKDGKKAGEETKDDEEPEEGAEGKDGKNPKPKGGDDKEMPAWAKALVESNKQLSEQLANIKGKEVANTRVSRLEEVLKDVNPKLTSRYKKDFNRLSFKDEEDFNEWLESVEEDTADFIVPVDSVPAQPGNGPTVTPPKGGARTPGKEKPSEQVLARVKARETEAVAPQIQGIKLPGAPAQS